MDKNNDKTKSSKPGHNSYGGFNGYTDQQTSSRGDVNRSTDQYSHNADQYSHDVDQYSDTEQTNDKNNLSDNWRSDTKRNNDNSFDDLIIPGFTDAERSSKRPARSTEYISMNSVKPENRLASINSRNRSIGSASMNDYRRRTSSHEKNTARYEKGKQNRNRSAGDDELDTRAATQASGFSHELQRRKQNLHDLKLTLIVTAICAIVLLAGITVYNGIQVSEISATGSTQYSCEQLIAMCGIQKGKIIFEYDVADIRQSFAMIPGISVVSVKKVFPNRIDIVVADHSPQAAIVAANGTYTLISSDGCVISTGVENSDGLILVHGLASYGFSTDTYINDDTSDVRATSVVELIYAINSSSLANSVTTIDVSNSSCAKIKMGENFTAILGTCIEAADNIATAAKAYTIFLRDYPNGGVINVFTGSTIVDFTPNKTDIPVTETPVID